MKTIVIGPKHRANEAKTRFNCDYVISIQDHAEHPDEPVATPFGVDKKNHKHFFFDDLTEEVSYRHSSRDEEIIRGHLPDIEDVQGVIDFFKTIPDWSRVYMHCFAGVSRSTAMAFACLCAEGEAGQEAGNLMLLERAALSRSIWPNDLIVKLADGHLDRKGSMILALKEWKIAEKSMTITQWSEKFSSITPHVDALEQSSEKVKAAAFWDAEQERLKIDREPEIK